MKAIINLKDGDVIEGSKVFLDGSKSVGAHTYQWRVLGTSESTHEKYTIENPTSDTTLVTDLINGPYYFELTTWNEEKDASHVIGAYVSVQTKL